ncbi:hypothetical protein [Rhodococcus sp. BS-15]|uniref:hypothetical protein n=1 Tax=Rhodococcus sp. BS-15 TaxID=1304954 RepID=UPI000FFCAFD5|nr:hypothetical protein [Rhodococcus sp. BS-15]
MTDGSQLRDDQIGSEIRDFDDLQVDMRLVQIHDFYTARPIVRVVNAPAANARTGRCLGPLVLARVDSGFVIEFSRDIAMPRFWHRIIDDN